MPIASRPRTKPAGSSRQEVGRQVTLIVGGITERQRGEGHGEEGGLKVLYTQTVGLVCVFFLCALLFPWKA